MGKHTGQNQFHGSTGGSQRVPKGGTQTVIARHVIGAYECWCQGELCWVDVKTGLQDWPGKSKGKAHPSQAAYENLQEMLTMQDELKRDEVKQFPKGVQDLLLTLVNECNIRCRPIGGTELLLYPPDGKSRPFKVMSRRGEKQTKGFIEKQFLSVYDVHLPAKQKKETLVGEPTRTFVAAPSTVPVEPFSARPEAPVSPKPTALPPHPQEAPDTASVWVLATGHNGEQLDNWETNGNVVRCIPCQENGKSWTTDNPRAMGGHTRATHGDGGMWTEEARVKSQETRRANRFRNDVEAAMTLLQTALGVEPQSEEVESLKQEVQLLKTEVQTLVGERDELAARLDLLKEALGV